MKKGLITLMVALLTLIGMASYGAVPQLINLPDIIIGDQEDLPPAGTANWFEFPNAYSFDTYVRWTTGTHGTPGYNVIYDNASASGVIRINGLLNTAHGDVYTGFPLVSYRNMLTNPGSGAGNLHPVGTSTPVIVYLKSVNTANTMFVNTVMQTVYTVPGAFDDFAGVYERVVAKNVSLLAHQPTPPWYLANYTPIAVGSGGAVYGMQPCLGAYNATTYGAYTLTTTGHDNDFGYWSMLGTTTTAGVDIVRLQVSRGTLIPYVDGAAYIVKANIYAIPKVTTKPTDLNPPVNDFVPWMRMRINSANESMSCEQDILSNSNGTVEVTTSARFATTETMIFDCRDQKNASWSNPGGSLQALYFSFDLIDFVAANRDYPGEHDEEGTVGITKLDIQTFPVVTVKGVSTPVKTYPVGASLQADRSQYTSASFSFGGTKVIPSFNSSNNMVLSAASNVVRGFGWFQLTADAQAVTPNIAKYYMYRYTIDVTGDPYWMRLRVFYGDSQRSVNVGIHATGNFNDYQFLSGNTFNVFMAPKAGETTKLFYAFDYLDFDPVHGAATCTMSKVEVLSMDPPPAG